ncbi:hypothetical protein A2V56_00190 [Candidatus Woesebacteria bacterium RBG_19FT_COMBO_42_9]|uniref:Glycosyltransferase 2-like domain-containing protein n=1 Tax=Candidatus Woesebacteria bacterium RBG_16_42_24 TaxID=1802485 RepID=A0A1F7XKL8_9BACT|nr:MAG: hypothetical protein A2V97_00935 [Candidatus Woesebacteria bacterium RBG_16_42_24]OGM16651.1 MAG: hypothetical protein A2V56_00190 [Candidatus Woesebacteria bacterium RBG_19FT_COMBO_42_9]
MNNDSGRLHSLSIIVPAYRAEEFIVPSLVKIENVMRGLAESYELICVVDGGVDKTYALAANLAKKSRTIKVAGYSQNRGKGYAVRYGMKLAKGEILGFIDAGLEIDPKSLKNLIEIQKKENADIVVGSKRHPDSIVQYPVLRQIISDVYYYLVKLLFNPKLSDTQAGIKIFKRGVIKKILPGLHIDGFAFDIEMLTQAKNSGFNEIYEAPINVSMVNSEKSSTIDSWSKLLLASLRMFYDTVGLFFRLSR